MDYIIIALILFIGLMIMIPMITGYIGSLKLNFQQAKVIHTYFSSGSSACQYIREENIDSDTNCPYKVGDNITVYQNGYGIWRIQ